VAHEAQGESNRHPHRSSRPGSGTLSRETQGYPVGIAEVAILSLVGLTMFAGVGVAAYFLVRPLFTSGSNSQAFQQSARGAGLHVAAAATPGPHLVGQLGSQDRTEGVRHGVLVEARLAHPQLSVRGVEGQRVTIGRARLDPPLGIALHGSPKGMQKRFGPKVKTGNPAVDGAIVVQSSEGERAASLLRGGGHGFEVFISPLEIKTLHRSPLPQQNLDWLLEEIAVGARQLVDARANLPPSPVEQQALEALQSLAQATGLGFDAVRRQVSGELAGLRARVWLGGSPGVMTCIEVTYVAPLGMGLHFYYPSDTGIVPSEEGADRGCAIAWGQREHPELDQSDQASLPGWSGPLRRQVIVKGQPVQRLAVLLDQVMIARLESFRNRGIHFSFEDHRALVATTEVPCPAATLQGLLGEASDAVRHLLSRS